MTTSLHDITVKRLNEGDHLQKNYPLNIDGEYGYICMSKEKLLLVREKGWLRKTYNVILDVPYDKISKIGSKGEEELELTDVEGTTSKLTKFEISLHKIETNLKELIETSI